MRFKAILVPLDGSEFTERALVPALAFATEGIINIAGSQKVDLIVMCSHGRSGIERWVFGSAAEKVLRGANCVTLVIRGQEVSK